MQISLNEKQQQAVEHRGGPLLIIAGAGTGKTAVITQRIIDLIKSGDAKTHEVLALTFTEKAASEMIERVDIEMPIGYEEMQISTFHSFCDSILRQDGGYIGLDTSYTLMTQARSYIFFRQFLFDLPLDKLRPLGNPTKNISDILRHFSRLQDEDVTPEEYIKYYKSLPQDTEEEKEEYEIAKEFALTYEKYEQLKIENSRMDFGDLITQSLRLFRERPNILKKYQERYRYILVDEFQDTNFTQNVLINTLVLGNDYDKASKQKRKNAELTVVGDDDQAIYKFRGAAISNILHFNDTYPDATKIVLTDNYRSKQEILDRSYDLIRKNDPDRLEVTEDVDKKLISKYQPKFENGAVTLLIGDNATEEADLIAKRILKLTGNLEKLKHDNSIVSKQFDQEGQGMFIDLDKGEDGKIRFSDIAILIRAHNHSDEIVQVLKHYGIPYKFSGPKGLYTRPEVFFLISFLRVLADYKDDLSMFNIIKNSVWGLNARENMELLRLARSRKLSLFELLEQFWGVRLGVSSTSEIQNSQLDPLANGVLSESSITSITKLLTIFSDAIIQIQKGFSLGEILFFFFKESGFMEKLLEVEDAQTQFKVQNISKYFDMLKQFEQDNVGTTVGQYVDFLRYSIEVGESPSADLDALEGYDAVNISTVHGAKGLEFPVVFLPNLVSQRFPTRNRSDTFPIPDPLVKDFIPEVSPAQEHLREERRLFYVGATRAKEKLFLTAAKYYGDGKSKKKPSVFLDELLNRKIVEDFDKEDLKRKIDKSFKVYISTDDDSLSLKDMTGIEPDYISYSHVDTYITCPKKYKYRYVLRVPGAPSSTLAFGRTVHNTLQVFYRNLMNHQQGLKGFNSEPSIEDLIAIYNEKWITEGYESSRHEQMRKEYGEKVLTDYFENMHDAEDHPIGLEHQFKYKMDNVIMKGSIDRIDLLEDGEQKVVELIDYKTGSAKEQKEVEKDLQLAIYSLVAEESLGFKVAKASLLYIEHGVKISVEVDDMKKDMVKAQVSGVIDRVLDRDFDATPGWHCKFCDYKEICDDAMVI